MTSLKKVFIADDEVDILEILTLMLKPRGYEVTATSDPNIIFNFDESQLPDLILLDIWMNGIDGRDICHKLKEWEHTRDIPVVFISANSNISEISKLCNAQGYIAKPFDMMDLFKVIEQSVKGKEVLS